MGLFAEIQNGSHTIVDSVRFAACWIGLIDHHLDAAERKAILDRLPDQPGGVPLDRMVGEIRSANAFGDWREIGLIFGLIQHSLAKKARPPFLQLVVDIVAADGRISIGERLGLMFMADLVGLTARLGPMFEETTGTPLTWPADLSDPDYWDSLEASRRGTSGKNESREEPRSEDRERTGGRPAHVDAERVSALAILGLVGDPSQDEIRLSYRRLARVHHPDRYEGLDADAIEQATKAFQRIQNAYSTLTKVAA